jgi:trk system potassium uptake protein TrkA
LGLIVAASPKSVAVVGLSKFGFRVATGLFDAGVEVLALDRDDLLIQKVADRVTRAVRADALDEEVLEHLGVFDVDAAVIGFRSSFDTAVLLTMMLRRRSETIRIVAQVDTDEKAEALQQLGGDVTIFPERDIADRLVRRLTTPDLVEHMDLAPDIAVIEMVAPTEFVGKSLADLGIRARHEIHVIGVVRPGVGDEVKRVVVAPPADLVFREGEVLLLLGKIENLNRFTDLYPRG